MRQWVPSLRQVKRSQLTRFLLDIGLDPDDYTAAHRWSVEQLDEFWAAIWERFGVAGSFGRVIGSRAMPGAEWFPGASVNYAQHLFTDKQDDQVAIRSVSEVRPTSSWTWAELKAQSAAIAAGLVAAGVGKGDRVAALMPNITETVAALLATASLGAIWSSAAPEFGVQAVIDRFAQIEPTVLLAVDGYRYGGRTIDLRARVEQIDRALPGRLVRFGYLDGSGWEDGFLAAGRLQFEQVPFEHPLWVLYSSGTTGLPKPIVHSQGGILLEQIKFSHLHLDAQSGDRVFWFTTTGWMMWNLLVGVLTTDAEIILYDGAASGEALWQLAAEQQVTLFGCGAAFIEGQMKAKNKPRKKHDLSALRGLGSTGSPLSAEGFQWIYEQLGEQLWIFSISGGTDVCTAFLGGVPTLPVRAGELQGPALGCAVEAWNGQGQAVVGEVGELVLTAPMPSMPVYFWGDDDGSRYRAAYFELFPGVWRHGDWVEITADGGAIISGRSDATINRGGVRIGTAEIYRAVLGLEQLLDALVVDVQGEMRLFVVLRAEVRLDRKLRAQIAARIGEFCSPRHRPDRIEEIAAVPRTLSGKVLEIPVKRILEGMPIAQAAAKESLANPGALEHFARLAAEGR